MIRASCHTADNALVLEFDATPWFREADPQSLLHLAAQDWSSVWIADALETRPGYEGLHQLVEYAATRLGTSRSRIPPGMHWTVASTRLMQCIGWPSIGPRSRQRSRTNTSKGDPPQLGSPMPLSGRTASEICRTCRLNGKDLERVLYRHDLAALPAGPRWVRRRCLSTRCPSSAFTIFASSILMLPSASRPHQRADGAKHRIQFAK